MAKKTTIIAIHQHNIMLATSSISFVNKIIPTIPHPIQQMHQTTWQIKKTEMIDKKSKTDQQDTNQRNLLFSLK